MEKKPVKATKAEVLARTKDIRELLLQGKTRAYIQQYASEKYGLSERVIDDYLSRATKDLQEQYKSDRTLDVSILLDRLFGIANKAEAKEDLKTASSSLMNIAKLKGLDQTTHTHIIEDKRELTEIPEESLLTLLDAPEEDK